MSDELMTKADAAKILGITPAAVLFLEQKGLLAAFRTRGGVRLFRGSAVIELARRRRVERTRKAKTA